MDPGHNQARESDRHVAEAAVTTKHRRPDPRGRQGELDPAVDGRNMTLDHIAEHLRGHTYQDPPFSDELMDAMTQKTIPNEPRPPMIAPATAKP